MTQTDQAPFRPQDAKRGGREDSFKKAQFKAQKLQMKLKTLETIRDVLKPRGPLGIQHMQNQPKIIPESFKKTSENLRKICRFEVLKGVRFFVGVHGWILLEISLPLLATMP